MRYFAKCHRCGYAAFWFNADVVPVVGMVLRAEDIDPPRVTGSVIYCGTCGQMVDARQLTAGIGVQSDDGSWHEWAVEWGEEIKP